MINPLCSLITPQSIHVEEITKDLNNVDEIVFLLSNSFNIRPQDSWFSADELLKRWETDKNTPMDCNDISVIAVSILQNMGFSDSRVFIGYQPSCHTNHAITIINNNGDYIDTVKCCSIDEVFDNPIVEFNDKETIIYNQNRYEMIIQEINPPLQPVAVLMMCMILMFLLVIMGVKKHGRG